MATKPMKNTEKPEFSVLLDWLEGRLDESQALLLDDTIRKGGAETEADIRWLTDFLETVEASRSAAPPPEVREELVRRFEAFAGDRRSPTLLDRLVAVLTFDSAAAPALAGLRSAQSQGKQRQLIFESELAEIALNIYPNDRDEFLTLSGQIFPKGPQIPSELSVQIIAAGEETEAGLTTIDELGEFVLEGIPQGRYGILISSDGFEITLPDIHLQR
jgi:hypothetical protein